MGPKAISFNTTSVAKTVTKIKLHYSSTVFVLTSYYQYINPIVMIFKIIIRIITGSNDQCLIKSHIFLRYVFEGALERLNSGFAFFIITCISFQSLYASVKFIKALFSKFFCCANSSKITPTKRLINKNDMITIETRQKIDPATAFTFFYGPVASTFSASGASTICCIRTGQASSELKTNNVKNP